MRAWTSGEHLPASALVVTTTLHCRKNSSTSSGVAGIFVNIPTTGRTTPGCSRLDLGSFKMPNVKNFRAIWARSASVGTSTSTRTQRADTKVANIVSVLPVPVGMTTVATSLLVDQCAWMAWSAPN